MHISWVEIQPSASLHSMVSSLAILSSTIPTGLQWWDWHSSFCVLFILTPGLTHSAPRAAPHLLQGCYRTKGISPLPHATWGSGNLPRTCFSLNMFHSRSQHRVLGEISLCTALLLHPPGVVYLSKTLIYFLRAGPLTLQKSHPTTQDTISSFL